MSKKVLIVDNDADFLETRADHLELAGYAVYRAISLDEAEQILDRTWIHVVIIDIRMRDDNDEKDTSGLSFAKQVDYRVIPKVVLTRNTTYEHVREALGPALIGLPPAVAFIAKQEGPDAMLQAVEQAFADHVRINRRLSITWAASSSFYHLASLIEPASEGAHLTDRASELEDVFRKLFYNNAQITIGRLFLRREGRIILEVFVYGDEGAEEQFVISCGQRQSIHQENARYEAYVPKRTVTGSVDKVKTEETLHFAGSAYTLSGCALEETTTFRELYQRRPIEQILATLDHLFQATLAPWYKKGRFQEEKQTLRELYLDWLELSEAALSQAELERRVEALCQETLVAGLMQLDYSPYKLTLHLADGESVSFPNPAAALSETRIATGTLAMCGITHGSVDADTVLVDGRGQTWLVDFTRAGRGLLLRDFVLLEAAIKLELLETIDLQARYALERRSLDIIDLDDALIAEGLASEPQQALSAVGRIRYLAAALAGRDRTPYLVGLLCCAMKRIVAYDPDIRYTRRGLVSYAHALLLAAMLYEKLAGTADRPKQIPPEARTRLWFDQPNEEIWVEGRRANLTPQEFKIFTFLYDHAGKLCSRQAIMKGALGRNYTIDEESLFNSAVSRLRQEIEPDPKNPHYIINVRGRGYRLNKHNIYLPAEKAPDQSPEAVPTPPLV